MPSSDIVERVERHFERQIAWLEDAVVAMQNIEEHLSEFALDELEREQVALTQQTERFMTECESLLREWNAATDVSESARTAARAKAGRAAALVAQLQRKYDEAAAAAGGKLAELRNTSSALRRGREAIQSYRPGGDETPGFVDKKA